jgi:hypothetical protein
VRPNDRLISCKRPVENWFAYDSERKVARRLKPERNDAWRRPNGWLISCKRLVRTYGPLSASGGRDTGGAAPRLRLSAALAG